MTPFLLDVGTMAVVVLALSVLVCLVNDATAGIRL